MVGEIYSDGIRFARCWRDDLTGAKERVTGQPRLCSIFSSIRGSKNLHQSKRQVLEKAKSRSTKGFKRKR
jgi:hypothetical protein